MASLPFQPHLDRIFASGLAQEVTYAGQIIRASVSYGLDLESSSRGQKAVAHIVVMVKDVKKPCKKDPITIAGEAWEMDEILSGDSYTWTLKLKRDVRGNLGA